LLTVNIGVFSTSKTNSEVCSVFQTLKGFYTLRRKGSILNLKGSIGATYLEPLKGSIQNPFKGSIIRTL